MPDDKVAEDHEVIENAEEQTLSEMLRVVREIPEVATANSVVGPAQEKNGHVAIPLASVSAVYGLGVGVGRQPGGDAEAEGASGSGGGGGGRASSRPVAVLEMTEAGIKVHQVVDSTRITVASLALAGWCVFWITRTVRAFRRR